MTFSLSLSFRRLSADVLTPVAAYLKLAARFGPGFLLESIEGGAARGRYSILGFRSDAVFRVSGGKAQLQRGANITPYDAKPFAALRVFLADSRRDLPMALPPMAAGVYGYMSYDCIHDIETIGVCKQDPLALPDMLFLRPTLVVVFDNVRDELFLVNPAYEKEEPHLLDEACAALQTHLPPMPQAPAVAPLTIQHRMAADDYCQRVGKAKDYIAAGDAFQIVLSQRFSTPFPLPAFSLYRALRRINPSPYLFFFDFEDFALAGSSPEICVQVRGTKITLRPIAGTARRGATPAEDRAIGERLLADPKERAEHLMLLDLGRNDVGRVAAYGSVQVEASYTLEHYSEVMHIVSQVGGTLRDGCDAVDALLAGFPAGTVSGAPKIRAMQIINELEDHARGPYAGCVGYFSANGDMDSCIVLRTGIIKNNTLYVQAGAGIVHDSVPENEQNECVMKARALFRAAQVALEDEGAS